MDQFIIIVLFGSHVQTKVREENEVMLEVIQRNTELLQASSRLIEERREVDEKMRKWQKEMVTFVHLIYSVLEKVKVWYKG